MSQPDQPPNLPPAGWYDDPHGGPELRYWDGGAWTDAAVPDHKRLRPFGEWFARLVEIGTGAAQPLFMIALVSLPVALVVAWGQWAALTDIVIDVGQANQGELTRVQTSQSVAGIVMYLWLVCVSTAQMRQLHASDEGLNESWSESLGAGFRRLPRSLGVWIVIGIASFLTFSVLGIGVPIVLGFIHPVLSVLAGFLGLGLAVWLTVRVWLACVPAAVAPKSASSIQIAWDMSNSRVLSLLGRALLVGFVLVVTFFVAFIANFAISGAALLDPDVTEFFPRDQLGSSLGRYLASTVVMTLVAQFAMSFLFAGSVVVYDDLGGPSALREEVNPGEGADSDVEGVGGD